MTTTAPAPAPAPGAPAAPAAKLPGTPGKSPLSWRKLPGANLIGLTSGLQRATLLFGLGLVGLFVLIAVFAPLIAPYGFAQISADGVDFVRQQAPSAEHWFGTSVRGEDVFSRVVFGARTALLVIAISLVLSLIVGVPLGLVSGYVGRWLDRILVLFMDAMYAFPSLLLAIVVSIVVAGGQSSSFGGMMSAAIAITVIFVPQYFRVVRNATVAVKQEPYVDAARVTGASTTRILFRHILANVTQSLPVLITLNGAEAILTLAGLGFLGFGIEPTQAAEWGYDLNKALGDIGNGVWWTSIFPGLAIVAIVLGMTLVGESLNEALNPLLRTRRADAKTTSEGTDD
ncbi:ABC transporter permease [Nocardia sp. IFM 10818]